jgi:hypothetical protein
MVQVSHTTFIQGLDFLLLTSTPDFHAVIKCSPATGTSYRFSSFTTNTTSLKKKPNYPMMGSRFRNGIVAKPRFRDSEANDWKSSASALPQPCAPRDVLATQLYHPNWNSVAPWTSWIGCTLLMVVTFYYQPRVLSAV